MKLNLLSIEIERSDDLDKINAEEDTEIKHHYKSSPQEMSRRGASK